MNRKLAARCLAELGNLTRLDIYRLLVRAGPPGLNISDIQTRLDVPASTLAFHLPGRVDHLRAVSPRSSALHYGWIILGAGSFGSFPARPDGRRFGFLRSDHCRSWHLAHFGLDRLCSWHACRDSAGTCDRPLD